MKEAYASKTESVMSITKFAAVAAFALVSSQALAGQAQTFDDSVTGSLPNRFEALVASPNGAPVAVGPTERRVNGVREVLIHNYWMIAPND